MLIAMVGCQGLTSKPSADISPSNTFSISGTSSPNGSGATLTLAGPVSGTTTTDSSGNYSFASLPSGLYTVTPSMSGFTFSPQGTQVIVSGASVTAVNFTATAVSQQGTFGIYGTVNPAAEGPGTTLTLSGAASATLTADPSGNYNFGGLASGSYTVVATKSGFTFSPSSAPVTVSGANVTGVNFTASTASQGAFGIYGTISPAANGAGATLTLSGAAIATLTADPSGNYNFGGLASGSYTVVAAKKEFAFSPPSAPVTVSGANVTGVNFTATSQGTLSISGTISPAANGSGATLTLSGAASATTTADSSGNYSFSTLVAGSYTVTASKTGFTLSPPSLPVTVTTNVTGVNFAVYSGSVVSISPGTSISSVVDAHPAGTTFVLQPGLYRLQTPITAKDGDIFAGPPCTPTSAPCTAIVSGGANIGGLATGPDENGNWSVTGQTQQGTVNTFDCDLDWNGCNYPEDLFINGVPLQHLSGNRLPALTSTTWWFDYTSHVIYFHQSPVGKTVETSVQPGMFSGVAGGASNVTVENLTIEEFATPTQEGAISTSTNGVLQNSYLTLNHGAGIQATFGTQVMNSVLTKNGQYGIIGGATTGATIIPSGIVIQGNTVTSNNYAHVSPGFGAGGIALGNTAQGVVRGNTVTGNLGHGIHFDVNSINPLIDGNDVENNLDPASLVSSHGIIFEIGEGGAVIRNNTVKYNGNNSGNQIYSSTSSGAQIYCNMMELSSVAGQLGWEVGAWDRGDNTVQPNLGQQIVSTGNYVHHNTIIWDSGATGNVGYWQGDTVNQPNFFANNTPPNFNQYHAPSMTIAQFYYDNNNSGDNTVQTFANYQAAGADVNGTLDSNYTSGSPSLAITSPLDQSTMTSPVTVTATASDPSGINNVEFYVDWGLQATVTSDPYSFDWTGATPGAHTVTAMAESNAGIRSCYAVTVNTQ
jgi:parallel beta-helix repeat protein